MVLPTYITGFLIFLRKWIFIGHSNFVYTATGWTLLWLVTVFGHKSLSYWGFQVFICAIYSIISGSFLIKLWNLNWKHFLSWKEFVVRSGRMVYSILWFCFVTEVPQKCVSTGSTRKLCQYFVIFFFWPFPPCRQFI